jgi:hypothetical protein
VTRAAAGKTAAKVSKSKERYQPVLTRYQVEQRGGQFFVIDTDRKVVAAGPYLHRTRAQHEADRLERNAPAPRRS